MAENINNNYFDGYYKDIWRAIIPPELTIKETNFLLQYFDLKPGSKVLDIMCGYGRHAIALAKKGIKVSAVDNLDNYINEIKIIAQKENLPIKAIKQDVLKYEAEESFDLAICMGNSFNFFSREEALILLSSIYSALKPGGHLLINSWSIAEIAIKLFTAKSSSTINGLQYLSESVYLFQPTRMETQTTIVDQAGKTETKKAVDYIFSLAEIETMLNEAGFHMKEIYSIPGKKKFTLGEPRVYIVAEKNNIPQ